ncbi:MAG: glutamate mutase L [Caldilineaceae bacterium]|nr:glutamate mutase L [Caldilineaceae bacterium]
MTETTLVRPATPSLRQNAGTLLALGISVEQTTLCLLENVSGHYRLAAWDTMAREAGIPPSHHAAQLCRRLGDQLGRTLWDEQAKRPLITSDDPITQPPLDHVTIGLSPRPRVRVWLLGLTEGGSMAAAHRALASAPLQLVGSTVLTAHLTSTQLATQLIETHPEALVLVGGYDLSEPTAQAWVLQLGQILGHALERLSPGQRPAIFYAGNRWCAAAVEEYLRKITGTLHFTALANVLPVPGAAHTAPLGVALSAYYWRLCQQLPGINQLNQWVTAPGRILNLEAAFVQLVQAWMTYHRLPRLHGLYAMPRLAATAARAGAPALPQQNWGLHVWAEQAEQGVQLCFVKPGTRPPELEHWPPLQLVSGDWPMELWPPPAVCWWDRSGLAPLVATIGQVAPAAMLQVLQHDLLEPRRRAQ